MAAISSAMNTAWQLTPSTTLAIVDQGWSSNITVAAGWFRMFIAPNTGAVGTSAAPSSFVNYLQALLRTHAGGSVWTITIRSDGFVQIAYSGTGTATITWDAGNIVRNALGFTGASASIPTGTNVVGTYHPTHTLYMVGRPMDTNWQRVAPKMAIAELPDGTVDGLADQSRRLFREFDSYVHPIDWATRSSLNLSATPWLPTDTTRYNSVVSSIGTAPPWSVLDYVDAAQFNAQGALLGNFQSWVSGSVTTLVRCYFSADFLDRARSTEPSQANNANHVNAKGVQLWFNATETF